MKPEAIHEYEEILEKVLNDLSVEIFPSPKEEDARVEKLSLIRMLVKSAQPNLKKQIECAVYGLMLSKLPVTDDNIKWLIRDLRIGFNQTNEIHNSTDNDKYINIYPEMNVYKKHLISIWEEYHPIT